MYLSHRANSAGNVKAILFMAGMLLSASFTMAQILSTGSRIEGADAQKILAHHNEVRSEVGLPALKWDPTLAEYAQRWAAYLATNNRCRIQHRGLAQKDGAHYGENIFWGSSAEAFTPLDASLSWYSEKEKYKYGRIGDDYSQPTGHYTQMVWRKTNAMGAGMAVCASGAIIVVANYNPPGNYVGEYPY